MRKRKGLSLSFLLMLMLISGRTGGTIINDKNVIPSDGFSISQYGITWVFDKKYQMGKFANGDYWVVGPVRIVDIYPRSTEISGRIMNGSMLNPVPGNKFNQGYDSTINHTTYVPSLNIAFNISNSNPLFLQNGSSIVSTISVTEPKKVPQLKTAAVLTVLDNPPPEGSFRPPYSGNDKIIRYNVRQLNYKLLNKLEPVRATPLLSEVEQYFERPWIDHTPGFVARLIHPLENMPDYGREIANRIGIASLMLNLNYTDKEKETLLIRFVQLGIDLFGIVQNEGKDNWGGDGGHASGRKWPILFSGIMLNDPGMKNIGQKSGNYLYKKGYGPGKKPLDYISFGEDEQTFYVTLQDVKLTNSSTWRPDARSGKPEPYTKEDIGLAEWGINHASEPNHNNKAWNANYRQCCTALAWSGFILAAILMEDNAKARTLWNHDALFDYQDRYMSVTASDGLNPGWRSLDKFTENMWDTYRSRYGSVKIKKSN